MSLGISFGNLDGQVNDNRLSEPAGKVSPGVVHSAHPAVEFRRLTKVQDLSVAELVELCAETNGSAAWDEFVSRLEVPLVCTIRRIGRQFGGLGPAAVEDLAQETYLKLCTDRCRLLLQFARANPEAIEAYIKSAAASVTLDYFKKCYSQKRGSGKVLQMIDESQAAASSDRLGGQASIENKVLLRQIDEILQVDVPSEDRERDRLIFWLHYRLGLTAKDISELPVVQLSAKGVESALLRMTRFMRERFVSRHSLVAKVSALQVSEIPLQTASSKEGDSSDSAYGNTL